MGKAKGKALVTNPDDKINIKKQMNPGSTGIRFNLRDHGSQSMMTSSQKVIATRLILKTNALTTSDDQQSVNMVCEENGSWDDTEMDHAYDHSSDQEANSDILFPDINSESVSDEEDSLFGTQ